MNIDHLFDEFNDKIKLTKSKTESLRKSRDAIRDEIRDSFSENERSIPKFCWQGSFSMKTLINPLESGDYDLDDGIYLQGYEETKIEDWPSTSTVHTWVSNAVKDHTSSDPIDKNTCIRIKYADGHHIDLPIYILQGETIYLAHKKDGWVISDPKEFRTWFLDAVSENGEQLRRLVRFLKAWKDYNDIDLKGIEITILLVNNFSANTGRDDLSLRDSIGNIIKSLEESFKCVKPVQPFEDLFDRISDGKKIIDLLKVLRDSLNDALEANSEKEASEILRKILGDRFPKSDDDSQKSYNDIQGVLGNNGRSA